MSSVAANLLAAALAVSADASSLDALERFARSPLRAGTLESRAEAARFEPGSSKPAVEVEEGRLQAPLSLHQKAALFDRRTIEEHRPWLGQVVSRKLSPEGKLVEYVALGDSLLWTGVFVASQAHRWSVTKEGDALRAMEASLWGLHALHEATGQPGLPARVLVPKEYASRIGFRAEGHRYNGSGRFKDWIWEGDLSFDQLVGWLFGISAAWPHIRDEGLRGALREDLLAVGRRVMRQGFRLKGNGTHLDFNANYYYQDRWPEPLRGIGGPPWRAPVTSLYGLHLIRVCATLTGDPELQRWYEQELILERELDLRLLDAPRIEDLSKKAAPVLTALARVYTGEDVEARPEWLLSRIGVNLSHMALYDLARLETDPGLRETYREALRRAHAPVAGEGNAFWDLLYASQFPADDRAAADARGVLSRFPTRPILGRFHRSTDPGIPKGKGLEGDALLPWKWLADEPLPLDARPLDAAFPWQTHPYLLDGGSDDEQGSGVAFSIAYWLGRSHGRLAPEPR